MRAYTIVALVAMATTAYPSFACDSVTLQYDPGYPPATSQSREAATLRIERCSPEGPPRSGLPIDEYFQAVRSVLAAKQIETSWGVPAVDAPYVRATVELDGRKLALIATAYDDGLRFPLYPTDRDKAYAEGMKEIVKLTLDRAAARYRFAPNP